MGKRIESIPKPSLQALQYYSWPGNARELRNVNEHAMIVSPSKTLEVRLPALPVPEPTAKAGRERRAPADGNLEAIERQHILGVLKKTGWRIMGQGGAAQRLGLKRTTLHSRMKKLGIHRPK